MADFEHSRALLHRPEQLFEIAADMIDFVLAAANEKREFAADMRFVLDMDDLFLAEQRPKFPHLELIGSNDLEKMVRGADVLVTVTPARAPIVKSEWVSPGMHIAALGADKGGDQELEGTILQRARIFVDDIRQCRNDGEINVPLSQGLIKESDIAGEIGEVVTGKKKGRTSDQDITLFDSTGIALQDSATIPLEYERALAAGVGIEKKMIST